MANNYLQFSVAIKDLNAKEREWLKKELDLRQNGPPQKEGEPPLEPYEWESQADFSYQFDSEGYALWMYAEEFGTPDHIADLMQDFLERFRPKDIFEMTWASTCSKLRLNEFSGGGVLVTANKQYWFVPDNLIYKQKQKLGLSKVKRHGRKK